MIVIKGGWKLEIKSAEVKDTIKELRNCFAVFGMPK